MVKRVSVTPSTVTPGDSLAISDLTKNIGNAPAKRSSTAYLLSPSTHVGKGAVLLAQRVNRVLPPHRGSRGSLSVTISSQIMPGTYSVVACADYRHKVKERKEKNNCRAAASKLTVIAGPASGGAPSPGGSPSPEPTPGSGPTPGGSPSPEPTPATCVLGSGTLAEGIDVSQYSGTIDFAKVAAASVRFVFARADAGLTPDSSYATYKAGATSAGLLFGAYQYFEPGQDPVAQADRFLSDAALGTGNLYPALDVETSGGLSASEMEQHIAAWLQKVQATLGVRPLIYTGKAFWEAHVQGGLAAQGYPLWIANWEVSLPSLPSEWSTWAYWQYTDKGNVNGITGLVDRDRFNGETPCTIG